MQVILRHASRERACVDGDNVLSPSSAPSTTINMLTCRPTAKSHADAMQLPSTTAHDHTGPPMQCVPCGGTGRDTLSVSAQRSAPPVPSFLPRADEARVDRFANAVAPSATSSAPFSSPLTTSMSASLGVDNLIMQKQGRETQRRRRGDADRVLEIFDQVDAHFASLEAATKQQQRVATTTTTTTEKTSSPLGSPQ
nr:hypothetical protein [Pandoravirus massiliensis]